MIPKAKEYGRREEIIDYLAIVIQGVIGSTYIGSHTRIDVGPWPCSSFSPGKRESDYSYSEYTEGSFTIFLPIIKNMSEEFFQKLKMFAAHEAAHVQYTFSSRVLTDYQKAHADDPLLLNVLNSFEDIRIEKELEDDMRQTSHCLNMLLPLSFKEFRKLVFGQIGTGEGVVGKVMMKAQFDLINVSFKIEDKSIRSLYDKEFAPIIKSYPWDSQTPEWSIKLTKAFVSKFRELFPKDPSVDSSGQGSEQDPNQKKSDGEGQGRQGKEDGNGSGEQASDSKASDSSGSEASNSPDSKGEGQGESKDTKEEGEEGEDSNGQQTDASTLGGSEPSNGQGASVSEDGTITTSSQIDTSEEAQVLMDKEFLEELNERLTQISAIPNYLTLKTSTLDEGKRLFTLRKYRSTIHSFHRLFTGGWRAPKHITTTEVEQGELDPEYLYKGKFKGRDRGIYEDTKKSMAEGLRVLVLLDNSGSMRSSDMQKVLDTAVVIDAASDVKSNIKCRIVYFTDVCQVTRDYADKKSLHPCLLDLTSSQGGTPTGDALNLELPGLLKQKGSKFVIVVTDGQPADSDSVKAAFRRYRDYGVKILYIEFGAGQSRFADDADYSIIYKSTDLQNLPALLTRDLGRVIKQHGKAVLKRLS